MPNDPYLEQRILSADPVELIQILYEHAVKSVREARSALAAGDIAGRSKAICRVIGILGELQASLNREASGAISQNLEALYRYMRTRLTVANLKQEDAPLGEVESLLGTLGEAWTAIRPITIVEPICAAPPRGLPVDVSGAQFAAETASGYAEQSWTA